MSRVMGKTRSAYGAEHRAFDIFYSAQSNIYFMFLGFDGRKRSIFVSVTNHNPALPLTATSVTNISHEYILVGNLTDIVDTFDDGVPF